MKTGYLIEALERAAIKVYRQLGPGLEEPLYRLAMCVELRRRGIRHVQEQNVDVFYEGEYVAAGR